MKSVPKLVRRFAGLLLLSSFLLLILNFAGFAALVAWQAPDTASSPYSIAEEAGKALTHSDQDGYVLSEEIASRLAQNDVWAIFISNDTLQVKWQTENTPSAIPTSYTLPQITSLATGYLNGYPTYTGEHEDGIVVLGFPKNSFWKHTRASWNYSLIAHLPQTALIVLLANIAVILIIYVASNMKILKSVKPITEGIQDLSAGACVHVPETGLLSEISARINQTSDILQKQQEELRKKETARANWISGVSHDIRTPLSMIMGYAGQLEVSTSLTETEQKKAAVIVKQSRRIKDLISDLNLASRLEYNMQPLMKKPENAVAIVRQVAADFIKMETDDKFRIEWNTDDKLSACTIEADRGLMKRAVTNLIQNSISHNENGCTIFISVTADPESCIICVEDNGIGASDEQINRLGSTPHYMVCDSNTTKLRHGMGLLIVRQITEAHHGKTVIGHSRYGGFSVKLVLPLIQG
ncbi:MAG: HAMP domain-containing histidine kinase [Clostridiales bacterium]|nr:HAMP domain-containing histidine kinase [Clostridiales bacterium]